MVKLCVFHKHYLVECKSTLIKIFDALRNAFGTLENVPNNGVWLANSPSGLTITKNPINDDFYMVDHCPCFDEDDCEWCS